MLSCWGPDRAFMKCWVTGPRHHRMKSYSPTDCWGQLHIRSCHMISLEESALSGPAFCLCHWLYWQIKSSVISGSLCTRRNCNSDKSMPGCIIRCWGYQMHVSLKHNLWLVFTVLTTGLLRSVIYDSQACQKCQTAVFQLLLFCCSPSLRCFDQHLHWVWGKAKLFRPFQRE